MLDVRRSMFKDPAMDLSDFRKEYSNRGLHREDLKPDPIDQFAVWFSLAVELRVHEPNAMTLATADASGMPFQRTVLLKQFDPRGFVFFTNYRSRIGQQLETNPDARLRFPWIPRKRQVSVHGTVAKSTPEGSLEYSRARPRESHTGAWVSPQSEINPHRELLRPRLAELETQVGG